MRLLSTILFLAAFAALGLLAQANAQAAEVAEFAGETIPLTRPETAEALDQELLLLSEAKSRIWLTLRRSDRYLPIIDAALTKAKTPADFRYLPMTLASLSPTYQSQGRAGLWRLSVGEAKAMGLNVTPEVDERLDPVAASTQAAQKINGLVNAYGSTILALAAFIDQGATQMAIDAAGGEKDFFRLYAPEPLEKAVYQVLAGKIIFANPEAYGYRTSRAWPILAKRREMLKDPANLRDLAAKNALDYKTIRDMNPHILSDVAPAGSYVYLP
jgi:membrane-bound lytic murein transglycosylase D